MFETNLFTFRKFWNDKLRKMGLVAIRGGEARPAGGMLWHEAVNGYNLERFGWSLCGHEHEPFSLGTGLTVQSTRARRSLEHELHGCQVCRPVLFDTFVSQAELAGGAVIATMPHLSFVHFGPIGLPATSRMILRREKRAPGAL